MRILVITSMLGLCAAALQAQVVPEDGCRQLRWVVEASIPDSVGADDCIDLSMAPVIDTYEERYRLYGDSLMSRMAKGSRQWYVMRSDGLWSVGWNDRITQLAHTQGVEYKPYANKSRSVTTDSVKVSIVGLDPYHVLITSVLDCCDGCRFIFADGDTVKANRMIATKQTSLINVDSTEIATSAVTKRWYAKGCAIPIVVMESHGAEGGTTLLTICPPSEQARSKEANHGKADSNDEEMPSYGWSISDNDDEVPTITAVVNGDMLTVHCSDGSIEPTCVMLCDALGRILRQADGNQVNVADLPGATYLVCAKIGKHVSSTKIWLDTRD